MADKDTQETERAEDDRLRLLSDAEREALEADDGYDADEENEAALRALGRGSLDDEEPADEPEAKDEEPEPSEDEPSEEPTEPEAAEAADEAESEAEAEAEAEGEPAEVGEPQVATKPEGYHVDLPDDFEDQLKANKDAQAEARRKFQDGDMDADEFSAKLDELQDQRSELQGLKLRAQISQEMRQQSGQQAWQREINSLFDEAASKAEMGLIDYRKDQSKAKDLDLFVRALAHQEENADKSMRWFLEEAHKRVMAMHGLSAQTKDKKQVKRKPDTSGVVQNLADVPGGAGDADPVGNEFAELDKLVGDEYERALSRMRAKSPEKYDRYLRV